MNDCCPKCDGLLEEYVGLIHCPNCHDFIMSLREAKNKSEKMARELTYGLQKLIKIKTRLATEGNPKDVFEPEKFRVNYKGERK